MDAIEFATESDDIKKNINESWNKVPELDENVVKIKHKTQESRDLDNQIAKAQIGVEDNDDEAEATEPILLERYKQYKYAAKKAKDMGDIKQAKQYIVEYKKIQASVNQLREGLVIFLADIPPELEEELWSLNVQPKQKAKPKPKSKPVVKAKPKPVVQETKIVVQDPDKVIQRNEVQQSSDDSGKLVTVSVLKDRIKHYQIAAVKAKKAGNKEKLTEYFKQYKELTKMLPFVENGQMKLYEKDLPPKLLDGLSHVTKNTAPQQSNPPSKSTSKSPTNNNNNNRNNNSNNKSNIVKKNEFNPKIYKLLTVKLKKQIDELRSDSAFLIHESPDDAQKLLNLSKQSQIMLTRVIQCQKQKLKTPEYEVKTIKVKVLKMDNEINDNELRLEFIELKNLNTKGKIWCYLDYKIDKVVQGQTEVLPADFGCKINHIKKCKIDRNKKLDKKFKYGKLHLQLFQSKTFRKPELIGKQIVKLKPLLDEYQMIDTIQLKNEKNDKHKFIADVDIKIRLRRPIATEPTQEIAKKIINITKYYEPKNIQQSIDQERRRQSQSMDNNQKHRRRSSIKKQQQQKAIHEQKVNNPPKQNVKQKAVAQPKSKPKAKVQAKPKAKAKPKGIPKGKVTVPSARGNVPNSGGLSQDIIDDPHNPIWFESFEVIMSEIESTQEQINNNINKDDNMDRLSMLNINKTVLEAKVTSQQLTLEQYSDKVKESMNIHANLAKYLNKQSYVLIIYFYLFEYNL